MTEKIQERTIHMELTPEFELAAYSNVVNVTVGEHEVVLTFHQVVTPIENAPEVTAKPVARVAMPRAVANRMCELLSNFLKK